MRRLRTANARTLRRILSRIGRRTSVRTPRLPDGFGLAAMRDGITIVAVRRGAIVWSERREFNEEEPLHTAVATLLDAAPPEHRRAGRHLHVALGGHAAQPKCLRGLPSASPSRIQPVIHASARRFFACSGGDAITGGVRPGPNGVWASLYDAQTVTAFRQAATAVGARSLSLLPVAAVLGAAQDAERVVYQDGDAIVHAAYDGSRRLSEVHRALIDHEAQARCPFPSPAGSDASAASETPITDALALGREAAYGAVLLGDADAMALRSRVAMRTAVSNARLLLAGAAAAVALTAMLVVPGLAAVHERHELAARLRTIAPRRSAAVREAAALARATQALNELAAFDRSRRPVLPLLTQITRALPPGSAIIEFRVDTASGLLVAVAPHASDVVEALAHVPGITAPTIVGPVTPEQVPQVPQDPGIILALTPTAERLTIRYQPTGVTGVAR